MVRVRRSVWSLGQPSTELQWYAKAIAAMRKLPFNNPKSWAWQGAVHGYKTNVAPWANLVQPPQPNHAEWEQCQHQTWFFLPWHRGYLACFESIVAEQVKNLGGPADWALPYWDYGATNPNALKLRPEFKQQTVGGVDNPLWSFRRPDWDSNPNYQVPTNIVDVKATAAMAMTQFVSPGIGSVKQFGGPVTGFMHYGGQSGLYSGGLESQPHNFLHDAIGGWMGNPDSAALDPIFWLHHANIDRIWQKWVEKYGAGANPNDPAWLSKVKFGLHNAAGTWSFSSGDVLDTRKVLHGYQYDDQKPVRAVLLRGLDVSLMRAPREPRLIGASDTGVVLGSAPTSTTLKLGPLPPPEPPAPEADVAAPRTILSVENVTGLGNGAILEIKITPPGGGAPIHAGFVSSFASAARGSAEGSGSNHSFDVTEALAGLGDQHGDLEVTFEQALPPVPDAPQRSSAMVKSVRLGAAPATPTPPRVGRVSLLRE